MRITNVMMAVAAIATMTACTPASGGQEDDPSAAASNATVSPTASASEEATPSAPPSAPASATPSPGSGGAHSWTNGYIIPGSDDVHFGPDWGPTWLLQYTIGEPFAAWPAGDVDVDASCAWTASFTEPDIANLYGLAIGDPRGEQGTAWHFEMVDPGTGTASPVVPLLNGEGLGVGASMDDVRTAYPGAVEQAFEDPAWGPVDEIDVHDVATDTHMYFWSDSPHGTVTRIQWGYFPQGNSWRGHHCAG